MTKQSVLKIAASLILVLAGVSAFAQDPAIKVTIPFEFQIGSTSYVAGEYRFTRRQEGIISMSNSGRINQAIILVGHVLSPNSEDQSAQVRFQCYDRQCFLSQIWIPQTNGGLGLLRSNLENELTAHKPGKYLALLVRPKGR